MYKVISATPSPYARKVRIALAKKGVPFELITEVPWDSLEPLPEEVERAVCQVATELMQYANTLTSTQSRGGSRTAPTPNTRERIIKSTNSLLRNGEDFMCAQGPA